MSVLKVFAVVVCVALSSCNSPDSQSGHVSSASSLGARSTTGWINNPDKYFREMGENLSLKLQRDPNNQILLVQQANFYGSQGDYKKAIQDLDHASRVGNLSKEVTMEKCLYMDRLYGFFDATKSCYNNLLSIYERDELGSKYPSKNYVFTALMAKSPNAKRLVQLFLNDPNASAQSKKLIKDFDRSRFLEALPPPKSPGRKASG